MTAVRMRSQECDRIKQRAIVPGSYDQFIAAAENDNIQILGSAWHKRVAHNIAGDLLRADDEAIQQMPFNAMFLSECVCASGYADNIFHAVAC